MKMRLPERKQPTGLPGLRGLLRLFSGKGRLEQCSDPALHIGLRAATGAVREEHGVEILPEYQPRVEAAGVEDAAARSWP